MLSVFFGDMPDAIYNTSVYFQNQYQYIRLHKLAQLYYLERVLP